MRNDVCNESSYEVAAYDGKSTPRALERRAAEVAAGEDLDHEAVVLADLQLRRAGLDQRRGCPARHRLRVERPAARSGFRIAGQGICVGA
jgi:hypothetical protein